VAEEERKLTCNKVRSNDFDDYAFVILDLPEKLPNIK
jgi:hypothetical protein